MIGRALLFLVNLSLQTGTFPENLKLAIVRPIHKKGDFDSSLSKLFDKVIYNQLLSYFNLSKIIRDNQYGFQKTTAHAAFDIVDKILQNVNINSTQQDYV